MAGVIGYCFQSKVTELAPPSGLEEDDDDEDDELPEAALVTCSVAADFAAFFSIPPNCAWNGRTDRDRSDQYHNFSSVFHCLIC